FQAGAPSHLDLFDPKPRLAELDGQPLPEEIVSRVRFAFIQKDSAVLLGSPRRWQKHGQCGMDFSDYLPQLATCADDILMVRSMFSEQFNHHPGQLLLSCGRAAFGLPTIGSWLNYGLGSESQNLPGYVVLTSGRGSSGGASLWSSGFLPSHYAGVLFRNQGDPVLNLSNPAGISAAAHRRTLDALQRLNQTRATEVQDPEIDSRIRNYELAFRMQAAAPELIDLSGESLSTLEAYGVDRAQHPQACIEDRPCLDGALFDDFFRSLSDIRRDRFTVIHTLGSHGPGYHLRYPAEFEQFKPACREIDFEKCSTEEIINAYDNTLLYDDHLLAKTIDQLTAI
ncbi:MAG: DUF1501 domain-containing protein, partial [Acidobacteria bacterium]|nr:DUF1501 domain-containing protein [Acidobacteriota bacterium]